MVRHPFRAALIAAPIIVMFGGKAARASATPAHTDNSADRAPVPLLVDASWLAKHYKDANVVLLHVGDEKEYKAAHIPGARYITMREVSTPHAMDGTALTLEFPAVETLREKFESLGISDDTHVVVYYGNDWVSPATRIVHTLNYIGLGDNVSVLDGGMPAWKKASQSVTDAETAVEKKGRLTGRATKDVTVTGEWVNANRNKHGIKIIDARARTFYDGVGKSNEKGRAGHVAGAGSLPFSEVADDTNTWLSKAALAQKFAAAGVTPGDTVVVYCHIGQQGTAVVFAGRLLGYNIRLYDGSFEDWDRHAEWPVEVPAKKGL